MFVYKIYVENDIIVKTEVSGVENDPVITVHTPNDHRDDYSDISYYEAMANQILETQVNDLSSLNIDLIY